jgi:hypothetical protein
MESAVARASGPGESLRVFVGAEDSQMVAARVLEFSIRRHASRPVDLTVMRDLAVPLPRDRKNRPRTGFSFYRFLIPGLCNYQGRALYLDADMLVFADLAELWAIPFQKHKVLCTYQSEGPGHRTDSPFIQPGRQLSVMLLDCARLDWDIEKIVRGLDEGRYTYSELMSDLRVVSPDEIADTIPPAWNHLEAYEAGRTKLLHYTVVSSQPWKTTENPLRAPWMEAYRDALRAGAVDPAEVLAGIESGWLHPSLAEDLSLSPASGAASVTAPLAAAPGGALEQDLARARAEVAEARRRLQACAEQIADLEEALAGLRASWTWRIGRLVTGPLGRLRRAMRRAR